MANKQDVDLKFSIIDGVTKFITDLKVAIKGVGTSFTELNQLSELVGKGFDKIGAAAARIGDAVAGAAALEDALARVGVRTNATTEQQIALQQAVESAVGATTFSAQEAAAALAALAEDGFSANDAAAALGETLVFANAAAIDAAEATGLLGTVLDKFAASPDDISGIADALTATAAAAGASTKAIAEGLAGIGTAAKTANVSIEDSVAILGTLAVEGVESSAAVGRLNKIFQDFAEPASKFSIAIKEAGLGGLEFVDVVAALQKDSAAASDVLATLGDKPREAMRLLLQEGGGDLESFTKIIDGSGGAAQAAADKLNSTFNGALTKLVNQLELARTKLLLPILEPLTDEFDRFDARISSFVQSDQFARISAQVTAFAEQTVRAVGDFVESFDFEAAIASVEQFATAAAENFNKIAAVAKFIGDTIGTVYDTVKGGAAGLVEAFTAVLSDVFAALGVFSDGAAELSIVFGDMSREARALGDEAITDLANRFGIAKDQAAFLKTEIEAAAIAARQSKGDFSDLKNALPSQDILGIANNFGLLADKLGNDVPKAANETKKGIAALNTEFDAAVIELRRAQKAYEEVFASGADGAAEAFKAVQKAGSEVARLRKELDNTKVSAEELSGAFKEIGVKSQKELIADAEKARKAFELITEAVKDGGAAQQDVARAFEVYASRLRETADGADEKTKRQIAQQIELAGAVAGVSKELIATATAALTAGDNLKQAGDSAAKSFEGAAKSLATVAESASKVATSFDETAQNVRNTTAAVDQSTQAWIDNENALSGAAEQNKITSAVMGQTLGVIEDGIFKINEQAGIRAHLARDAFERLNPEYAERRRLLALQESANIAVAEQIKLLESQNPELVKEAQQREALSRQYRNATEGLDRLLQLQKEQNEVRNDGLEIGQQELAQNQEFITNKPGSVNNVTINVNISGSPNTQAYWRQVVSEFIFPELKRLERLEQ